VSHEKESHCFSYGRGNAVYLLHRSSGACHRSVVTWVIWSIVAGGAGAAVVADKTKNDHEQAQANNQRQEEPKGMEDTALASQQSPN
jgi:hypothetical protein